MLDWVEGGNRPSASLRIAGEPIARHQLEIAAAAGAKRLLVLGDPGDERVEMMLGAARVAGLQAKIIRDAPALCAEVTAADEMLIFGDSLMADATMALDLCSGRGVATLPVEQGLAAGFERIDAEYAWAGLMIVPGSLAERLRELPRDCDIASSLLRIALMTRLQARPVDPVAIAEGRWNLIRSETDAQAAEKRRLDSTIAEASGQTVGTKIAGRVAQQFGGRFLEQDHGDLLVAAFGMLLAGAALAATGFQLGWLAFLFMGLSWMVLRGHRVLQAVRRQARMRPRGRDMGPVLFLAFDALLVAVIAVNGGPGLARPPAWFAAFMAVALLRLGAAELPFAPIRPWLDDRFLLCLALALSAIWAGPVTLSMLLAGVIALGWIVLTFQSGTARTKLTRP
jgi:hypothetical protein